MRIFRRMSTMRMTTRTLTGSDPRPAPAPGTAPAGIVEMKQTVYENPAPLLFNQTEIHQQEVTKIWICI